LLGPLQSAGGFGPKLRELDAALRQFALYASQLAFDLRGRVRAASGGTTRRSFPFRRFRRQVGLQSLDGALELFQAAFHATRLALEFWHVRVVARVQ
jgi:hypothetical protein